MFTIGNISPDRSAFARRLRSESLTKDYQSHYCLSAVRKNDKNIALSVSPMMFCVRGKSLEIKNLKLNRLKTIPF